MITRLGNRDSTLSDLFKNAKSTRSSVVEQQIANLLVAGSNPAAGFYF